MSKVVGVTLVPKLRETPRNEGAQRNLPAYLPRGNEAQCPICDRIFGSDYACEKHKPYSMPKSQACKDPASLGMILIERDGRPVWLRTSGDTNG